MNQPNYKSNLFNFEPNIVAMILWILSILGLSPYGGVLMIIGCFIILKYERKSDFLRNHVSQILGLALISTVLSTIMVVLARLLFLRIFIPILAMVNFAVAILLFALALLGALKAYNKEKIDLPIIGFIGNMIEESIKPN